MAQNGKTPVWSSAFVLQFVIALVGAAITGVTASYTLRDQLRVEENARMDAMKQEILALRAEDMKHVVTLEAWLDERRQERERLDGQYYNLLNTLQRIQSAIKR